MMDAKTYGAKVQQHWNGTVGYFNRLPPHLRTINGLIHDTDDPDLFKAQLGACYMLTSSLLAGIEGVTLD